MLANVHGESTINPRFEVVRRAWNPLHKINLRPMKTYTKPRMRNPNVEDPRKRFKDHDLRVCTWNVRTLNSDGASIQLVNVLKEYRADITALQEIRWKGQGCKKFNHCDVYYSCHDNKRIFGCGFAVGERLRNLVMQFTPVNERLAAIRIRAKYFNISLICAHAPTEDKDDEAKESFYERLEEVYDQCPRYDVKIVLGDFNAKVGREGLFGPAVGKFSLHANTSDNGYRLIDFAVARNMVISSTRFQHLDIHKATWLSPDQNTANQIDHVLIDGRHSSSILDVRTIRGANMDSDHYLVAAKVRTRITSVKKSTSSTCRKFAIEKLQTTQTATDFANQVSNLLVENPPSSDDVNLQWKSISHCMRTAAEKVIGYFRPKRNSWYDQECEMATAAKTAAYKEMLHTVATRAVRERYRELRREEKRVFRRKKREAEKRELDGIEMNCSRNEARKFYERVKRQTGGSKTGAAACRDENGNLVTDIQGMLRRWRDHFNGLLNGSTVAEEVEPDIPITDDGVDIPPPDYDEVVKAVKRLKNNKAPGADGIPAELFKTGGEELLKRMHKLLCKIWSDERMPSDWNLSILCPIHKKGDSTVCANYRGISLLNISYKVLSSVLCERLKPIVNNLIGPYQCGFRPGKSTIDQIFTLRQILEKTLEKQIDTHHLFVDYKAAFDSTIRSHLYETMSNFGIAAKLIRLCRMTLRNTSCAVLIGKDLTTPFETKRGFRQGDSLSCDFFNLMMERIVRAADLRNSGTIFYKSFMLLAYADDIDIIGLNRRAVTAAFSALERESRRLGLVVNEDKTKYMLSTVKEAARIGSHVSVDAYNFEAVNEFVYLGTSITNTNNVSSEIKRRITLANRCYYGLNRQLSSRALSRRTKLSLYKTLILPVLLYGAEAWTMTAADEQSLGTFERKILRKIFGPICVDGEYARRMNHQLYELYDDVDLVRRVKIQRLRWLGHVVRMDEETPARKVFDSAPSGGQRRRGRPFIRWRDQVENNINAIGISNWRQKAVKRNVWRDILYEAKIG